MSNEEVRVHAQKLQVAGYRDMRKADLIEHIATNHLTKARKHLRVAWWRKNIGELSLVVGIVGILVGIIPFTVAYLLWVPFDCAITKIEVIPDVANDVFDGTDINNWKLVSEDELSTVAIRLENRSSKPATFQKGTIVIESYSDPLKDKTPIIQAMRLVLMDHTGHHVATIGKMSIGEQALFPFNQVVPAESPIEFTIWVRLVEQEKPPVTFVNARVRLYSDTGEKVESELVRLEIHEATEDFVPKLPED